MKKWTKMMLCSASLMAFAAPQLAYAQSNDAADEAAEAEDIVITGTLIRGTAPVGSNSITLGETKLEETGAISSNELLASIPQVTNYFNRVPIADLSIAVNQIQISRPNLRNIGGNNASSSPTLILVDGHRVATAGVNQASIDPDLIPTGAIERVEVVTEGGSATYGADAVAGVINFITRKKFDGVKLEGNYGIAKNYWQVDAGGTVGKTFDNGSVYASYTYTKNDALFGRDRDFIQNLDYSTAAYRGRDVNCSPANLSVNTVLTAFGATIASTNYAAPGFVAGTSNRCDLTDDATTVPKAQRHGALAGLNWNFGESTELDVRAYWSQRKTEAQSIIDGQVNVGPTNPFVSGSLPAGLSLGLQPFTIFGSPVVNQAAVTFNLKPLGLSDHSTTNISTWGAVAELTQDLGENWQIRALANYGNSNSRYQLTGISQSRLNAAGVASTTATAFNPFNVTANSPALIADLLDEAIEGQAKDKMLQLRAIAEGKLFELPGGDLRVAFGYEYMKDTLDRRFSPSVRLGGLSALPFSKYSRNVNSLFGEVNAPLISNGDGKSMLTIAGSGRYDKYSDFGSTFNPKVGFTFEPTKGFILRGNWGTSFTAPTPVDQLGSLTSTISGFPFVPFVQPGVTLLPGSNNTIAFQGSRPNLQPQEADTWSVGFDLTPTKGARFYANYYSVKFDNILGTPTPNVGIFTNFPSAVLFNVSGNTAAQVTSFLTANGTAPLTAAQTTQLNNTLTGIGGGRIVEVVDFRVGNYGILKVNGIDGGIDLNGETGFGSVDVSLNFNIPLTRDQKASPTAAVADVLQTENPQLFLKLGVGANFGKKFRALATLNHTGGYNIPQTTSIPFQDRVGSFSTYDLFFKYDLGMGGILSDLSLTLNIDNVFDRDPPLLRRNNPNENGFANGFTLGRLFNFGISKKF